jgi:hypothetical protein
LVGCNTDGIDQNLTQDLAKAIYNDTPELRTAEITGRKGDMQINPDGTKTMETGSEKMIYQWNGDFDQLSISIKTNNNAIIWMFVSKILGGLDCNVAVAILNDNVASESLTMDHSD